MNYTRFPSAVRGESCPVVVCRTCAEVSPRPSCSPPWGSSPPLPVAHAAELNNVITNVDIAQTQLEVWQKARVDVTFAVPAGAAGGDTFTLVMPDSLLVDPSMTFPVMTATMPQQKMADATVSVVGGQTIVTFTLTDYVNTHSGVTGSAYFESTWDANKVTPGTTEILTFLTGATSSTDSVFIVPTVQTREPSKWQTWVNDPTAEGLPADDNLTWGLMFGEVKPSDIGTIVTFTDTPRAGQKLDCATIQIVIFEYMADGSTPWLASDNLNNWPGFSCSTATMSFSLDVPAMVPTEDGPRSVVGLGLEVTGYSQVTHPSLSEFTNDATISQNGIPVGDYQATYVRSSGGGSGDGTLVVSVGDTVWRDLDRDGVLDAGEPGIAGIELTLHGPDGSPVLDTNGVPITTFTDANGNYRFTGLPPLAAGDHYTVRIAKDQPGLAGLVRTPVPGMTDGGSVWESESTDLTQGNDSDLALDFGFAAAPVAVPSVSVGDLVWKDLNGNGIQDRGEPGIAGVVLTITGPDGPVTDVNGQPVGPITTDTNGHYTFTGLPTLPAGQSYTVTLDTTASASALTGLQPTTTGQGTTATDSSTATATTGDLTTDGDTDDTLDFGFRVVPTPVDSTPDPIDTSTTPGTGTPTTGGTGTTTTTPNGSTSTTGGSGATSTTSNTSAATTNAKTTSGGLAKTGSESALLALIGGTFIGLGSLLTRRRTGRYSR